MTTTQNFAAKAAVAFVAIAMAFTLVAPSAKAQDVSSMSLEQLVALVNQLQAQLSGSVSTSSTCSYTFTRSLGQGATGADVMNLQKFLNSDPATIVAVSGAGSAGMETSFYGPATAAAVSKFQTKYSADILVPSGLTSPTGYFGPSSMAKANKLCDGTTNPTGPTTGGDLKGGAGNLDDADFISSINNEDVGEGQDDVEVLGLELEADDNSDLRITAVRVELVHNTAMNGSDDLDDYADEVSVWFEGDMVGSVDVDDMNESNDVWSQTMTLDAGAIIRSGDVADLVVAVTALNNIDSTDLASNDWSVKVASVRYVDAQGAVITDSSTGDINVNRSFEFTSFANANDVELSINEASDNPSAGTVETDSAGDEVTLLIGEMEAEGSDIEIDELVVNITPTGSSTSQIASEFLLLIDGDEVSSVSAISTTTAANHVFEDIEYVLEEGDTVEFEVVAVLNEVGDDFGAGSTLTASVAASSIVAEDEAGDDLTGTELKGSANGEAIAFRSEGISLSVDTTSAVSTNLDTASTSYGTFKMRVEVTAIGETMYIPETVARDSAASSTVGATFQMLDSNGTEYTDGSTTQSWTRVSGGSMSGSYVRINEGQTATFELNVTLDPAAAGQYRAQLISVGYGDDNTAVDATEAAAPATDFRTGTTNILN